MRCTSRVLGDVVICVSVPVSVPDVNRPDDRWSHRGPAFQKPVVAHQMHIAETNRELRRNLVFPKSHVFERVDWAQNAEGMIRRLDRLHFARVRERVE
jgi:hypothetical protein